LELNLVKAYGSNAPTANTILNYYSKKNLRINSFLYLTEMNSLKLRKKK